MDLRRSMLETDGPRHQALRKLLLRDFSPATLRRYEDFLRGLAQVTVDAALRQEEFDFVDAIAADYPINVLARLLDVPESSPRSSSTWGNEIVGATDPDYARVLIDSPEAENTATSRSARLPPSRSSSTAASSPPSARAATATTWSAAREPDPGRRRAADARPTSTTTSCCWSWRATRPPGRRSATR